MKKINVSIITYKQEALIGRAIDSIIEQKEWGLNKIIICDDCSPDNNWIVIQEYKKKYPELIEAYRNDINLGVYGNFNRMNSLRGVADLYTTMAGDDILCPGYLKAIQEAVVEQNIAMDSAVCIYCDYQTISPDGTKSIVSQKKVLNGTRPYSMMIRSNLSNRGALFTSSAYSRIQPTILDKGLNLAETFAEAQINLCADLYYYVPIVGSVYYQSIGVSTSLRHTNYYGVDQLTKWHYFLDNLPNIATDRRWIKYKISQTEYSMHHTWWGMLKVIIRNVISFDSKNGKGLRDIYSMILFLTKKQGKF